MHHKSLSELRAALTDGECSSEELTRHFLARIRAIDDELNSFITVTEDEAIDAARAADERLRRGEGGPLTGIPIAHKDLFCTEGVRTSCGSKMLDNFVSPYDATLVHRAKDAGLVMLGKTNMDEFAMGSSNENSYYGPVRNPWSTDRVPGGSSGGSAAAVSARLTPIATGTDTGGSIRQPASMCGVSGLKPTYGRISRYGMVAFASSLDQAGILAHSAEDIAHLLPCLAGLDERDSTSADTPVEHYAEGLNESIRGLKVGVPREYFGEGLADEVGQIIEDAIATYASLGLEIVPISLPNTKLAVPTYYVVAPAECSSNLSRFDGVRFGYRADDVLNLDDLYKRSRTEAFGTEVKRRIMVGTHALSAGYYDAYYLKAQKLRRLISQDFQEAFESVDVIMGPTAPTTAFKLGEKSDDPITMYLSDIFTTAVNLAGLPAMTIPAGFSRMLPVGLQLIGDYFSESRLLNLSHQFQNETDWHLKTPAAFT